MKLSRRLIPAIAMLMVSAVLMSTASFAWFTMNNEVTAKGMTVNAVAASSLVIMGTSNSDNSKKDTDYTNIGTNNTLNQQLKACTSYDGKNFGILAAGTSVLASDSSEATWGTNGFQPTSLTKLESLDNYVVTSTYSIKNIGAAAEVYVSSISVNTTATKNIKAAIRVGISLDGGTTVMVFNAGGGSLNGGEVGKYNATETKDEETGETIPAGWQLTDPNYITAGTQAAKIGDLVKDEAKTVTVYVWFEGQDTECKSTNVNTNDISIEIVFTNIKPAN